MPSLSPLQVGPLAALSVGAIALAGGLPLPTSATAAIAALCATWWVTEALPIAATSLIPFALFPLLGVATPAELSKAYGHPVIQLILGGFLLSRALERSGAHRRLALALVRTLGGRADRKLLLGFMFASATLSLWISNSATTLMLLPVVLATTEAPDTKALRPPLLLGTAYAASIGGLGTPVGSPPNAIFIAAYQQVTGVELSFLDWMRFGVPAVLCLLPVAWLVLARHVPRAGRQIALPTLSRWTIGERRTLAIFAITALLWVSRTAPFGGWQALLPLATPHDSTIALLASVALFAISDGKGERLLDWESARTIPWGLLLLFGGGLALATGFETSGLSATLAGTLGWLASWPRAAMLLGVCLFVTFLTELTSNSATATLLMPVLAVAAQAAGQDPMILMAPAALSASCAFMLPVATAPNAIVFGTGAVSAQAMARAGLVLNVCGAVLLTLLSLVAF